MILFAIIVLFSFRLTHVRI